MIQIECYNQNMLQENTYLLTEEKTGLCAVIDPGCFPASMRRQIEHTKGLRYIILTHAHGDHIAALPDIHKAYPKATIVAGIHEKDLLTDASRNGSTDFAPLPVEMAADRYVDEGDVITLGDTELRVISTPGHTSGGICLYGDGKLFSGDTLFRGSIGRTDLYGGDFDQIQKSLRKLMALPDDTVVYTGHGPVTTIAYEKRGNPFV